MIDFKKIWVELYRPSKLDDLILDDQSLRVIQQIDDEIPNFLFVGSPGTGKTTLARIIVNDILGCNYLYINASDESGIDTIRHNITNFAQTKSFDGGIKVVILDECLHEDTLVTVLNQDGEVEQVETSILEGDISVSDIRNHIQDLPE
jgi:DNA polymerase III delta prime subunit